jgi:hypothetical protein
MIETEDECLQPSKAPAHQQKHEKGIEHSEDCTHVAIGIPNRSCIANAVPMTSAKSHATIASSHKIQSPEATGRILFFARLRQIPS